MSLKAGSGKREGGRHGPRTPVRRPRALAALLLAIVAAMAMALSGGFPSGAEAAGFERGAVTVICADGVAKTVILDDEGNPMDPYGETVCAGVCLCGAAPGVALPPAAQAPVARSGETAGILWQAATTVLLFERGRCAAPRGPPSEDIA